MEDNSQVVPDSQVLDPQESDPPVLDLQVLDEKELEPKLLDPRDLKIRELEESNTQKESKIQELLSQLDKYKSVLLVKTATQAPGINTVRRAEDGFRKSQRAWGISAEPQSSSVDLFDHHARRGKKVSKDERYYLNLFDSWVWVALGLVFILCSAYSFQEFRYVPYPCISRIVFTTLYCEPRGPGFKSEWVPMFNEAPLTALLSL